MPQDKALPVIYQIAKGCEYLYDKGIFHRDIKTENILICHNGITAFTQEPSKSRTSGSPK